MVRAIVQPDEATLERWLDYGGEETLQSYGIRGDDDLLGGIPSEHLRWLSSLPYLISDGHRVYVHAGLMPGVPVEEQPGEALLWIRERFLLAKPSDFNAHVVHGHTPVWEGKPDPGLPELLSHRTNLDTGAFSTGILSIAVFETATAGGPIELLRIAGAPAARSSHPPVCAEMLSKVAAIPRRGIGGWLSRRSARVAQT